jgi:C-terminal processing protease CtpA/Prc
LLRRQVCNKNGFVSLTRGAAGDAANISTRKGSRVIMDFKKASKKASSRGSVFIAVLVCLFFQAPALHAQAPKASGFERDRGHDMVKWIREDLKNNYYDPAFRGIDIDGRLKAVDEKINSATSIGHIFGIIAQAVSELDDSHTFFLPPGRSALTEYGWEMQMIGDKCLITAVKPGSDADAKGIKEGDEVWLVNDFAPTRDNLWKLEYLYKVLRPQPAVKLTIKRPDGKEDSLMILARVTVRKQEMDLTGYDVNQFMREAEDAARFIRQRYAELGDELLIWKMPDFELEQEKVDELMDRVRKHKALILDLRGNPGGYVSALQRFAGYFFDHDVKIADRKGRKEMKPQMAKTRGDKAFKGQLVVLVDSRSASAAELFARIVQLEHRGTVLGDHSSGAVMESKFFSHQSGLDIVAFWGVSVTNADLIMSDGKSLEKTGVTADETILPNPADLAAKRDPVLARAAELVGVKLDPAKAGSFFPVEWRK